MTNEQSRKWWQKKRYILPALIFLPPVGIPLVWLSQWTRSAKIVATVLSGLIWIGMIADQPGISQTAEPSPKVFVTPESKPTAIEEPSPAPAVGSPIREPISGSCQCPYDTDSRGRRCGGRSAYSKPGGESPVCYS
jgi:hypothetical protein